MPKENQSDGRAHDCDHEQIFCAHGHIHAHRKSRVIGMRMAMCTSKPIIGKDAPSPPPTYFPALTIFLVSAGRGILRLDILPNISPKDHCLKLNPGTAPPWFELLESDSKSLKVILCCNLLTTIYNQNPAFWSQYRLWPSCLTRGIN